MKFECDLTVLKYKKNYRNVEKNIYYTDLCYTKKRNSFGHLRYPL